MRFLEILAFRPASFLSFFLVSGFIRIYVEKVVASGWSKEGKEYAY